MIILGYFLKRIHSFKSRHMNGIRGYHAIPRSKNVGHVEY